LGQAKAIDQAPVEQGLQVAVVVLLIPGHEPNKQGCGHKPVALDHGHGLKALLGELPAFKFFRLPDKPAETILHFCFGRV
ncbi:MAG: hypothetical protein ACREP9_14380, partial [Candidatus Dormibacteraceae bacterium]